MAIHHCPRCEFQFSSSSEVRWHLPEDHDCQALVKGAAVSTPGPCGLRREHMHLEADSIGSTEPADRATQSAAPIEEVEVGGSRPAWRGPERLARPVHDVSRHDLWFR